MARPARNYTPEDLGLGSSVVEDAIKTNPYLEPKYVKSLLEKGEEKKLAQQRVHHVVRTINKNNSFGEDGSIPMQEAENQLNSDWLAKGWVLISCFLVGRN